MEELFFPNDLRVQGQIRAGSLQLPDNAVTNNSVQSGANLSASKLEQQPPITYRQKTGTAVVADTDDIFIVRGATGSIVSVDAALTTAISAGSDRTITIDIQKGNAGAGFTTLLSSVITLNQATAVRTPVAGALVGSPTLADGDILRVVVAVTGSTGTQGQGLVVTITTRQKADP